MDLFSVPPAAARTVERMVGMGVELASGVFVGKSERDQARVRWARKVRKGFAMWSPAGSDGSGLVRGMGESVAWIGKGAVSARAVT